MSDDFSELLSLEADLRGVPDRANRDIMKALEVTGRNVKDDWRQGAEVGRSDPGFAKRYASSIFYDVKAVPGEISVEIGPEIARPGGTAGFLEDEHADVRSKPQHAGRNALEANEDDFVRGLEIAVTNAIIDKRSG